MKSTELMIGNWVKIKGDYGKPLKITTIDDTYNSINYFDSDAEGELTLQLNEIEPIPLTNEILEKNGFKPYIPEYHLETVYACQDVSKAVADELYALWPYQDGSFYLLLRVDGKDMVRMDVHYIHQLQQALMFCEIEKEIAL